MSEKDDTGRWPETLGNFYKVCPREYSKPVAIATARSMMERYGTVMAIKRASRHRLNYPPESWGRKHWDVAISWLRAQQ